MPRKRKQSDIGRKSKIAKRSKACREQESDEKREERLANVRSTTSQRRDNETAEEREERLAQVRSTTSQRRENETAEDRKERLAQLRRTTSQRRNYETEEEREERLAQLRSTASQRRNNETEEEREERLAQLRSTVSQRRNNETEEERGQRLAQLRTSTSQRRNNETEEEREERLLEMRVLASRRLEHETVEHREARLNQMSNAISEVRESESQEERRQRLCDQNRRTTFRRNRMPSTKYIGQICKESVRDVQLHHLGGLVDKCQFCGSKNFKGERPSDKMFTYCCQKGKVEITPENYPSFLKELLETSQEFRTNIWRYNSAHAFVSFGCNRPSSKLPGRGPDIFSVHGATYHLMSTATNPEDGQEAQYAQLYFLDTEDAVEQRLRLNSVLDRSILRDISSFMMQNNVLAQSYKMMRYVINDKMQRGSQVQNLSLLFSTDAEKDKRRYNAPQANEVAVVFQNADGEPPSNRDIRVYYKNSNKTTNIPVIDDRLDALTYPILFPLGKGGFKKNMPLSRTDGFITQMMYYSYILAIRDDFSPFLEAGKLVQVFVCDAYVKMEANRLNFIKTQQQKLRRDSYTGLKDFLEKQALQKGLRPGNVVVLPSSFLGSPRNMQQRYLDAMTMVAKFGKPDLFITMTCNPKWTEITKNLPHIPAEHKPGLIAKVFNLKRQELIHDLIHKQIFGKVTAFTYVIEFQKRGLPHVHLLLMLANEDKPRNAEDIDKLIWAEIPENGNVSNLQSMVLQHMIHGPCEGSNANKFICTKDSGKCMKEFPKSFQDKTMPNSDGYAKYQRRNTGTKHTVRSTEVDNSWVVPYNPYLLSKFDCHINVEFCASIKSVKYLYKYVYKGHDCAHIEVKAADGSNTLVHDETKQYIDSRYVCAVEAMWRINGYSLFDRSHTIVRLPIHLENEQSVRFAENEDIQKLLEDAKETMLTAYFKLNAEDEEAANYYYPQIPEHYVYDQNKRIWKVRRRGHGKTIGRMHSANFNNTELFYLRVLLLHVKGARSYKEIRTVSNICHQTFKAAAIALHLVEDDTIWKNTLMEAVTSGMPLQIRQLFAMICAFESPENPLILWETFKDHMIEDFVNRNVANPENQALLDIEDFLRSHGKSCAHFRLPVPEFQLSHAIDYNQNEERDTGVRLQSGLNQQQQQIFDMVINAINNTDVVRRCFCVDGPAGTGKTYLFNTLMSVLRGRGSIVLPCASTGISATLLKGGRTYHSLFKLPIPLNESSVSHIRGGSREGLEIRDAKLIIWDEVSMTLGHAITAVDRLLKDLMNDSRPFGGKVILFAGDFRQNLPVVKHAHAVQVIQASVKANPVWRNHVLPVRLTRNMRTGEELQFAEWLLQLGEGRLPTVDQLPSDTIEIPEDFIKCGDLITEIFGNNITAEQLKENPNRAILCPKNEDTFLINDRVLNILQGEKMEYLSIDFIETDSEEDREYYPLEFLNSITPTGMPPHILNVKVGAMIILLRNINTKRGLCNGTRLIVTEMKPNLIYGEVLAGPSKGQIVFIPRVDLRPADSDFPFTLKRRQFPVRVAFAMTVNKSQGQTLSKIGIFLPNPVFAHGQLYVAFSRATSRQNVRVSILDAPGQQGHLIQKDPRVFTKNVVYREIL